MIPVIEESSQRRNHSIHAIEVIRSDDFLISCVQHISCANARHDIDLFSFQEQGKMFKKTGTKVVDLKSEHIAEVNEISC